MSNLVGGMCSIICHMALILAFMHLYCIFNLLLPMLFKTFVFNLVLKRQSETVNGTSISYIYMPFFFTTAIPISMVKQLS